MKYSFASHPEEALATYHKNGYFVEESVFTSPECGEFVEAGMQLPGVKAGDFSPAMQPHRDNPVFLKAMRHRRVVGPIARLVSGNPVGLQTEFFYGKSGVKGFAKHQDNFFVEADAEAFASAWIALVDVGPENGGLTGYPGSHKEGRLPVRKIEVGFVEGQDPNANNEESIVPPAYKMVDIPVSKGSIVFLHAHFVHASRVNQTGSHRFALLCTYLREGAKFRAGRYAQREPIAI